MPPGIPDRKNQGDLSRLKPGQMLTYLVQEHTADRAGKHYDVRLGNKDLGLYSWATKKELPAPGEKIELHQQPLHTFDYKEFQGKITKGYGKGDVRKVEEGTALITTAQPDRISFSLMHKRTPERLTLINTPKGWLFSNYTPTKPIPYEKIHYKNIKPEKVESFLENLTGTAQPKIDGAASLTAIKPGKLEILSYRVSKRNARPIIHTERVLREKFKVDLPSALTGTVLRGELYGVKDGKVIPPQELGGILNSSPEKALQTQKDRGIKIKNMIFDVTHIKGKPIDPKVPYEERLKLVRKVVRDLPDSFELPEEVSTPADAKALLEKIRQGQHPLTREGLVVHSPTGAPVKIKLTQDYDVFVRKIFPGEGKYTKTHAGGFEYSLNDKGGIVGRVGTGLSDELRKDMHENPTGYIGRVARIASQEQHTSGAYRAPVLIAFHEDYPMATGKNVSALRRKLANMSPPKLPTAQLPTAAAPKAPMVLPASPTPAVPNMSNASPRSNTKIATNWRDPQAMARQAALSDAYRNRVAPPADPGGLHNASQNRGNMLQDELFNTQMANPSRLHFDPRTRPALSSAKPTMAPLGRVTGVKPGLMQSLMGLFKRGSDDAAALYGVA